jgi:hypothetical protein
VTAESAHDWWRTFFDRDYLSSYEPKFSEAD